MAAARHLAGLGAADDVHDRDRRNGASPGVGGIFRVSVDDDLWDREVEGGFPDLGRLKRDLVDRVSPGRDLGHTDRAADQAPSTRTPNLTPCLISNRSTSRGARPCVSLLIRMILSSARRRPWPGWTEAGKSVRYAMVTSGEAGIDG